MRNMTKICSSCGKRIQHSEVCQCKKDRMKKYKKENHDGFYNTVMWKRLRKKILKRDDYICQRCLNLFDIIETTNLQVHHIKSRVNHPHLSYEESNLITVCRTCNLQLGTKDRLDFEYTIKQKEDEENFIL